MTGPSLSGFDPADSSTWHPRHGAVVVLLQGAARMLDVKLGADLAPAAEHIARGLYPTTQEPPGPVGPPWVLVVHLPDDTPPAEAHAVRAVAAALPAGSEVTALAADAARSVLDALPPEVT